MKYVLSSLVMPCTDEYFILRCKKVSLNEAKKFVKDEFISAVGHEGTAKALSQILETEIPANRIFVNMEIGDEALAIQITERLPEGKILSKDEIMKMYEEGKIVFRHIIRAV